MRLTFVLPDVFFTKRSGGYRVHYEMANRLSARGHQVTIVHKTNSRRVWARSKLWPMIGRFSAHDFVPWFKISPAVRVVVTTDVTARTAPHTDVFLFTSWATTLDLPKVRDAAPCIALVWDYEFWLEGDVELRGVMRGAFAQTGLVLVAGSVAVESMLDAMGLTTTSTVPPGIDLDVFRCSRDITARESTVGFLNRPGSRRGIGDLLDALAQVLEIAPTTTVWGGGRPEPDMPSWIEWRGTDSDLDLSKFYNDAAIFVLPSHTEGLGLPALEAMACGAAVVVTDNGGSRQYARDGENCLVVPPRDPDQLAAAIVRLLSDSELRGGLAHAGAETANAYAWDRAVSALEQVIERVFS